MLDGIGFHECLQFTACELKYYQKLTSWVNHEWQIFLVE